MKLKSFTLALTALFFMGIALSSCTKEGPTGPAGADGKDGKDGAATCGECHNLSTDLYAKIIQYEASTHANGGNFERATTSCAPCHTHEGFLETRPTQLTATLAEIMDPTPPNCRTCHPIHKTYTAADYDVRYKDATKLFIDNTKSHDMGKGNICTSCHQPRPMNPVVTVGGPDITIASSNTRWGYHYGIQAAMIIGTGGYEYPGGNYTTPPASHKNDVEDGCIECHMGKAFGAEAGGHTWMMKYNDGANANVSVCTTCHPGITNFDVNGVQTEITDLLDSLKTILIAENIYNATNDLIKPGTYSADKAGAYLNYKYVYYDGSHGVHNYEYAKALLTNAINALK
jgi:hypothetical protein